MTYHSKTKKILRIAYAFSITGNILLGLNADRMLIKFVYIVGSCLFVVYFHEKKEDKLAFRLQLFNLVLLILLTFFKH